MKKMIVIISAGAFCFFASCGGKGGGGMSAAAKKNLDAAHIVSNAFETGDTSKVNDAVAADFVDHSEKGDMPRDSLKAMITMMKAAHKPDDKMTVENEFANDDYALLQIHFTGTSDGGMGMPAGPYDFRAIEMIKCKDGKAVEHWSYMQPSDMMKMMPPPPMNNKMDTTKMKTK